MAETTTKELHLYEVDDGEQWILAATSEEEVLRVARERYDIGVGLDEDEKIEVRRFAPDKVLAIGDPDGAWEDGPLPEGAEREGATVRATCAAWAKWAGANGFIGGSVW